MVHAMDANVKTVNNVYNAKKLEELHEQKQKHEDEISTLRDDVYNHKIQLIENEKTQHTLSGKVGQ